MKKISTKLNFAMLLVTFAVLAFVGITLIINLTFGYYRAFERTVTMVFGSDGFQNVYKSFDGDTISLEQYLESSKATLCQSSQKDYYILKSGNVVKSSREGGILSMTDNLSSVLEGGYSHDNTITSDELDFAFDMGHGYTVYVIDTREELYSQLRDITALFLQALLFGIALAALLSFFISKRLTASVKTLEDGARQMSKGDFSHIEVKTHDEIAKLCEVFNEMGDQIQSDFEKFEAEESARRDFTANVSHELKTPLTVIKSYSQTLNTMEVDKETQSRFLSIIDSEVDRMTALVGQLLYLSKLENQPLQCEAVDLNKLCQELTFTLKPECDKKDLTVDIRGEAEQITDKQIVKTIVLNLLTNAVKYSENGGHIIIEIENTSPPRLTVTDNGIGIPPQDIEHIFERFYRTDKARGRQTGGTGLGLAIAKENARLIDASLKACSEPNKYTKFTLEF